MLESEQRSILNKPNVELTLSSLGGGGSARLTLNADTSITITYWPRADSAHPPTPEDQKKPSLDKVKQA